MTIEPHVRIPPQRPPAKDEKRALAIAFSVIREAIGPMPDGLRKTVDIALEGLISDIKWLESTKAAEPKVQEYPITPEGDMPRIVNAPLWQPTADYRLMRFTSLENRGTPILQRRWQKGMVDEWRDVDPVEQRKAEDAIRSLRDTSRATMRAKLWDRLNNVIDKLVDDICGPGAK